MCVIAVDLCVHSFQILYDSDIIHIFEFSYDLDEL